MSVKEPQLRLAILLNAPKNDLAPPLGQGEAPATILGQYSRVAKRLESAKFDLAFVADTVSGEVLGDKLPHPEPVTLFSALAAVTERLGLVITASTTFSDPYNLARQLLSLDHLSNGRVGWNVVTSSDGERNFGDKPIPLHSERYNRGLEFVEVARKLWLSWDEDAVVRRDGHVVGIDAGKIHPIHHKGKYFSVDGALAHGRSPQGHPVLIQAGSSEDGKNFAAKFAEAVYTAQQTLAGAQEFYRDLKAKTRAEGRDPNLIKILPGVCTIIGDTESSAKKIAKDQVANAYNPVILAALEKQFNGVSLKDLGPEDAIPAERLPLIEQVQGRQSRYGVFYNYAVNERWTVRQLAELQQGTAGHGQIVGTPEQVADHLENWFRNGGADGFTIMPSQGAGGVDVFVDQVVPILQKRGLFRTEYEADTLRGNLGLDFEPKRSVAA